LRGSACAYGRNGGAGRVLDIALAKRPDLCRPGAKHQLIAPRSALRQLQSLAPVRRFKLERARIETEDHKPGTAARVKHDENETIRRVADFEAIVGSGHCVRMAMDA
jgi:hypothetical protein